MDTPTRGVVRCQHRTFVALTAHWIYVGFSSFVVLADGDENIKYP